MLLIILIFATFYFLFYIWYKYDKCCEQAEIENFAKKYPKWSSIRKDWEKDWKEEPINPEVYSFRDVWVNNRLRRLEGDGLVDHFKE